MLTTLRHLLKEYLELDDKTIEEFIKQCEAEWKAILIETPDISVSEVMEKLIGIKETKRLSP